MIVGVDIVGQGSFEFMGACETGLLDDLAGSAIEASLTHYVNTYNHPILQRSLNHISPVQALKKSQPDKPLVFVKRPCNRARHATKFVPASL